MNSIRVLVLGGLTVFRRGLVSLLRAGDAFQVVGRSAEWSGATRLARELQPDVILLDAKMPGVDAAPATQRLLEVAPRAGIIMLAPSDRDLELLPALEAGAVGYVRRDASADAVLEAIRRARADATGLTRSSPNGRERTLTRGRAAEASALECVISAVFLPYGVSAVLFATVLGPPGTVALGLLATGSMAQTAGLFFGGMPPTTVWQQALAVFF